MGWFHDESDEAQAYDQVKNAPHKAELSHELLASAVAYQTAKAWEKHQADNGKPDSHAKAKEIVAALTAGVVDRLVETKGLDYLDKEKAKHEAKKQAEAALAQEY